MILQCNPDSIVIFNGFRRWLTISYIKLKVFKWFKVCNNELGISCKNILELILQFIMSSLISYSEQMDGKQTAVAKEK